MQMGASAFLASPDGVAGFREFNVDPVYIDDESRVPVWARQNLVQHFDEVSLSTSQSRPGPFNKLFEALRAVVNRKPLVRR